MVSIDLNLIDYLQRWYHIKHLLIKMRINGAFYSMCIKKSAYDFPYIFFYVLCKVTCIPYIKNPVTY